jgi:hypothetical protein
MDSWHQTWLCILATVWLVGRFVLGIDQWAKANGYQRSENPTEPDRKAD